MRVGWRKRREIEGEQTSDKAIIDERGRVSRQQMWVDDGRTDAVEQEKNAGLRAERSIFATIRAAAAALPVGED